MPLICCLIIDRLKWYGKSGAACSNIYELFLNLYLNTECYYFSNKAWDRPFKISDDVNPPGIITKTFDFLRVLTKFTLHIKSGLISLDYIFFINFLFTNLISWWNAITFVNAFVICEIYLLSLYFNEHRASV